MSFDAKDFEQAVRGELALFDAGVKAIPADKLEWSPGGKARTVMSIMAECAYFPDWLNACIEKGGFADEGGFGKEGESFDELLATLHRKADEFLAQVKGMSTEELAKPVNFPWESTDAAGAVGYYLWNLTYHYGQINYIQLLLGDEEMHMPTG